MLLKQVSGIQEWYIEEDGYPTWLVGWFHGSQIGSYDGSSLANVANFCSMVYATGTYFILLHLEILVQIVHLEVNSNRQPYSVIYKSRCSYNW